MRSDRVVIESTNVTITMVQASCFLYVYEYELSRDLNSVLVFIPYLNYFSVILAADQSNARSILLYQTNLDKVQKLSSHSAMEVSGPE
jgi:hypothetical protein